MPFGFQMFLVLSATWPCKRSASMSAPETITFWSRRFCQSSIELMLRGALCLRLIVLFCCLRAVSKLFVIFLLVLVYFLCVDWVTTL